MNPEEVQRWIEDAEKTGKFALGQDDLRYTAYMEKLNDALKDKLPKNSYCAFKSGECEKLRAANYRLCFVRTP